MLRAAIAFLMLTTPATAYAADGPALYKRCAACHLASGAGVPGAFPSLKTEPASLAAKPDGRKFLVLAVTRGLSGPMIVEGKTYRGVMPAQAGMKDDEVAAVLNHVLDAIAVADKKVQRFSADEVSGFRKGGAALTPKQVADLKAAIK